MTEHGLQQTVLVAHNYYQQPGGEDVVVAAETALLRDKGHHVILFTRHNDDVTRISKLALARNAVYNSAVYDDIKQLVRREQIDVVHVHNTLPLLSPAVYYGARDAGAAVVQTLHNYRYVCPAATLYRNGQLCEDCLSGTGYLPAVAHGCHKNRMTSLVTSLSLAAERRRKAKQDPVNRYIALTDFARDKLVSGGLPNTQIAVKPNFLFYDPGPGTGQGDYALFVGRLSEEKGIKTMLHAWRELPELELKVVGDGPLETLVSMAPVTYLGRQPKNEVVKLMQNARLLIFPSEWYEGFPMTLVEALACGLPVVASRLGSMASIIDENIGALFTPGDASSLVKVVKQLERSSLTDKQLAARKRFEACYSADRNYTLLMAIYAAAQARRATLTA